jgi:acetyl esterase/lipase
LSASLCILSGLAACGALDVVNSVSPSDSYESREGIAYGSRSRQLLDVYVPVDGAGAAPVVVFFYGGGWRDGARGDYAFVASSLTRAGFVVVIPDYRLYPEVVFPDFVADAAAAVAWSLDNASLYGGDPGEIHVMGHSAGAHLAALLATDGRYLGEHGRSPTDLAGLIGLSGPYDFLPIESGYLLEVFPESLRERSQPINYVSPDVPRTLLIHGGDDSTVEPGNSRRFAEALRGQGVDVTLDIYPGIGHGRVVVALAPPLDFWGRTLEDCVTFIRAARPSKSYAVPAGPVSGVAPASP